MIDNEYSPDTGKALFEQRRTELEQGLRKVAAAMGSAVPEEALSIFFQRFMGGFWTPFEEVSSTCNKMQSEISAEIQTLEQQLLHSVPPDAASDLEQYGNLLSERSSEAQDYAFLVGFQCAIRFLLLGISQPATILQAKKEVVT